MSEFLKEYHLYDQMSRLNNENYFASDFQVKEVDDFLSSLREDEDVKANEMTLRIYLSNLRKTKEKSVYIVLKWLFCLHRVMEQLVNLKLIERVYDNLSRVQAPRMEDRIDDFVHQGIVRPYIHFMAKLCLVRIHEREDQEGSSDFNKENMHSKNSKNNLAFMKLNLVRTALSQLVPTLLDLRNYLHTYYSLLANIPSLLHRDLAALLKDVRSEMKISQSNGVTAGDLQAIQVQLQKLQPQGVGGEYEFFPLGEVTTQMNLFMHSGGKEWDG